MIQKEPNEKGNTNKASLGMISTAPFFGNNIPKSQSYSRFLTIMNRKAQELKMMKTHYANSHGLVNTNNKSTAYDIALLSEYAMRN